MKERFGRGLALLFVLMYASLGIGCFWRERRYDGGERVYVERRHDEHEHERHQERHEERRENERR